MVKFFFTNQAHMPANLPERAYAGAEVVDSTHADRARFEGEHELAEVGRVREGRVDTGEAIIKDVPMTSVAELRRGLANAGYWIIGLRKFEKPEPGRTTKWVIEIRLAKRNDGVHPPELTPEAESALRLLATDWWMFHGWDNGNRGITLNCVMRTPGPGKSGNQPKHRALHEIRIRDGSIVVLDAKQEDAA